jgi:predicted PurR-regulated permease PerM
MFEFTKPKTEQRISVNPNIIYTTIGVLLGLYFLYRISSIIILLFLAFLIMVALNPSVSQLHKKTKLPRIISIIIVYIFFITAVAGMTSLLIPPLVIQGVQLLKQIDVPLLQEHLAQLKLTVTDVSGLVNQFSEPANFIVSAVASTFTSLFTFFTLLVLSFYLILERDVLHHKIAWLSRKESHLAATKDFLDSVEHQLSGWVRGELILMTVIGAMTFVGLTILGVPYALPLAILAGLLEILPSLGPTISAVPAIALAAVQLGTWPAVAVLVLYIVIQQLENNLLVPRVMQTNADVDPLAAIIAILIGFQLMGFIGGLLAVPTYIFVRTAYSTWRKFTVEKT